MPCIKPEVKLQVVYCTKVNIDNMRTLNNLQWKSRLVRWKKEEAPQNQMGDSRRVHFGSAANS